MERASIPTELKSALIKAGLWEDFEKLAPSHQCEYAKYVGEAKKPETRLRRAEKAVSMLAAKQKAPP